MKKHTLAPAVLASFAAAGLVLAPGTALAHEPGPADQDQSDSAEPLADESTKDTPPAEDPSPAPAPQDDSEKKPAADPNDSDDPADTTDPTPEGDPPEDTDEDQEDPEPPQSDDDDSGDKDDSTDEDPLPSLVAPSSIAVDDVMVPEGEDPGDRGLRIKATDLSPGAKMQMRVTAPADTTGLSQSFTITADSDGIAEHVYFIEWVGEYDAELIAGVFTFELVGADDMVLASTDVEFTTEPNDEDDDKGQDDSEEDGKAGEDESADDPDDAVADPSLTVSPDRLPATDFTNYDKGVQVSVTSCLPGESVSLEVLWPDTGEVAYANGNEADDDGAAGFSFYGTGSNPSDYVGTWTVNVSCGGETESQTFTVTGKKNNSQGGDDSRSNGSDLPRTGSEAGVLAITAMGLLTVGAATVMVSSRPKRRDMF